MNSLVADISASLWKVGGALLVSLCAAGFLGGSIYGMTWAMRSFFGMSYGEAFLIGQPLGILVVAMTGLFGLILAQKRQARRRAMERSGKAPMA